MHRLSAAERAQIFDQLFDASEFYPQMAALCDALVNADTELSRAGDVRARVRLEQASAALTECLLPRTLGMAAYAAQDIVSALTQATHFLRDRHLQFAFGVQDFWGLLDVVGSRGGVVPGQAHRWLNLGQNGAQVLTWLARGGASRVSIDPSKPEDQQLIAAAERWRMDWSQSPEDTSRHTSNALPSMVEQPRTVGGNRPAL
jgi:hypothetical protein